MRIEIMKDVPLAPLTTLKVGGRASHFVQVTDESELDEARVYAQEHALPIVVLGGGSNVLVPDSGIHALVIQPMFTDVTYADEGEHTVLARVGAGVVLDTFIAETVRMGLWGLENLSSIPGSVGGVPVQNVGAYGVEAKDVVTSVTVFDMETGASKELTNEECHFGYRTSLFKNEAGRRYIITHVSFRLSRTPSPKVSYKDLMSRFAHVEGVAQSDIRSAVIAIRREKFPDWHIVGTAGSFFKNPIIDEQAFSALKERYPDMPGFPHDGKVKVSLGWILDHVLHLKGYREGSVGLYEAQALVLVTYGVSSGEEIFTFSESVIKKIFDATGIRTEREVVVL